jgi:hypothetical protein
LGSWYGHFNICSTCILFEKTSSRISFTVSLCKVIAFYSAPAGTTGNSTVNNYKKPWSRAAEHLGHDGIFLPFFQVVTFEIILLFDVILNIKFVADGKTYTYSTFRHREPGERSEYGDYSMG